MSAVRILQLILIMLFVPFSAANEATSNILVLGDSLSAGYGIKVDEGWVNLVQQRLGTDYSYQLINASVSGETSGGGLARLPALLAKHQPKLVIIELGANDGLRGYPINIMRQNLSKIIQLSQDANARILLLGMQIPPNYGARYTKVFATTYADLARDKKLAWIPFFLDGVAGHAQLMQRDGLHPTAEAQAILAETVWSALEPLL